MRFYYSVYKGKKLTLNYRSKIIESTYRVWVVKKNWLFSSSKILFYSDFSNFMKFLNEHKSVCLIYFWHCFPLPLQKNNTRWPHSHGLWNTVVAVTATWSISPGEVTCHHFNLLIKVSLYFIFLKLVILFYFFIIEYKCE